MPTIIVKKFHFDSAAPVAAPAAPTGDAWITRPQARYRRRLRLYQKLLIKQWLEEEQRSLLA